MQKVFLAVAFVFLTDSHLLARQVVDFAGHFSPEEIAVLEEICADLEKRHQLSVVIRIYPDSVFYDDRRTSTERNREVLFVHIGLGERRVVAQAINSSRADFLNNVFHQWVEINLKEGRDVYGPLQSALEEVDKEYTLLRELEDYEREWIAASSEEWTPRTRRFVHLCFFAILLLVIRFTIKNHRSGNAFENVEFYGLSRMTRQQIIALAAAMILFTFRLVRFFPYEEMGIILIFYSLAFYPFIAAVAGIIMWVADGVRALKFGTSRAKLSLAEKLYLIRPHVPTETLMEMNFYQLVYEQRLKLRLETVQIGRREVDYYFVRKGEQSGSLQAPPDLQVFVDHLPEKETELEKYLNEVYESFGRFKAFRKDFLLRALVYRGLHVKWLWPFNVFVRTRKGQEANKKIRKVVAHQNVLAKRAIDEPASCADLLSKLDRHLFLLDEFERKLDDLYNVLFEYGQLAAIPPKLQVFFEPSFSFRYFNRKLRSSYFYESAWAHWSEDDD